MHSRGKIVCVNFSFLHCCVGVLSLCSSGLGVFPPPPFLGEPNEKVNTCS